MKTILITIFSLLALAGFTRAAEKHAPAAAAAAAPATATPTPGPVSVPASAPVIELKTKSAFTVESGSRNPFWPIGWKPSPKISGGGTGENTGADLPPSAFLVSTIMLDPGAHFAIINGKAMVEGQTFGLQMGSQTYQLTVKRIEDGRVILGRRDQEIVVPLRRK